MHNSTSVSTTSDLYILSAETYTEDMSTINPWAQAKADLGWE